MLVAPDGRVWTGTADGGIHVHDPAGGSTTTVAVTGGRPLGLENLPDGRILVCDAHRGLLALDPATGALGPRSVFGDVSGMSWDGGNGVPDGSALDDEGGLWCALPRSSSMADSMETWPSPPPSQVWSGSRATASTASSSRKLAWPMKSTPWRTACLTAPAERA